MSIYIYVLVMAVTTYLIRALPLTLFKKPIRSRFLRSFLHYVPTACLTAMTFPAILTATDHMISGAAGLVVGVLLASSDAPLRCPSAYSAGCLTSMITAVLSLFIALL